MAWQDFFNKFKTPVEGIPNTNALDNPFIGGIAHSLVDPSGKHIPFTDTGEPHNTHEWQETKDGQKFRPSMSIEMLTNPGLHDPEAVKEGWKLDDSNVIPLPSNDEQQSAVSQNFLNAFIKNLFGNNVA
jgi:hypothetical protein